MNIPLQEHGVTFSSFESVRQALFNRELEQYAHKHYEKGNILEDVVMQLHNPEHRERRRVENPMFRREAVLSYERERIPTIIHENLDRMISAGVRDVVAIGHMLAVVLSAEISGVDIDGTDLDEVERLVELERVFAAGASITDSTRDKQEIIREVQQALAAFRVEFYDRSLSRRRALLERGSGEGLSEDLLTRLLLSQGELGIDDELVMRETAFMLESGAHTSALTLARTMEQLFRWSASHPERWMAFRAKEPIDMNFVQASVAETIRLYPIVPITRRRALSDIEIDGTPVEAGTIVYLDNVAANRDPAVFGEDADTFDPFREMPSAVQRFGHGFGGGMHACIGRVLAMGVPEGHGSERVYGEVSLMVRALLERGIAPDPDHPEVTDTSTHRERIGALPVVFASVDDVDDAPERRSEGEVDV